MVGFAALAVAVATPVLALGHFGPGSDTPSTPDPNAQLAEAQARSPYPILLPQPSPDGYALARVDWTPDGDTFNADMWWSRSETSSFHIWESNVPATAFDNPDQGPDPTVSNEYLDVAGAKWAVSQGDWGSAPFEEICDRTESGISVCVGSTDGLAFAEQVAASLTTS